MKHLSKKGIIETMEDNFAAAALTEADLETARRFLLERESAPAGHVSPLGAKITSFINDFENSFAAAAMVEGNVTMAREFLKTSAKTHPGTVLAKCKAFLRAFEVTFAAAAMSEGSPELAREFLQVKSRRKQRGSFNDFLKNVGLKGVQVQYRIAFV